MRRRFVLLACCGPLLGCELLAGIDDRQAHLSAADGGAAGGGGGVAGEGASGGSGPECEPGQGRCNSNVVEVCDADGRWALGTPCPETLPICSAGACASVERFATGLPADHTCALLSDTTTRCWGRSAQGQVGVDPMGDPEARVLTPVEVAGATGATELSLGKFHSCALVRGSVLCWGLNDTGQLGDGHPGVDRWAPAPVEDIDDAVHVASGYNHTCAIVSGGNVKCWGLNSHGQLGTGDMTSRDVPALVLGLTGVAGLSLGELHTCARLVGGTAWCWGYGEYGQLGNGTMGSPETTPVIVSTQSSGALTDVLQIDLGAFHSCARRADKSVYCWGGNGEGQLGDTTLDDNAWARPVASLENADGLGAGYRQTCARKGGSVWCVGGSLYGDLGTGLEGQGKYITSAKEAAFIDDVTALFTMFHNSCVVRQEGAAASCWGGNEWGEIGNGTLDSPKPTAVAIVW